MFVAELHVYPIKGARGVALDRSDVLRGGLRHDRRFMAVTPEGRFITQREHPKLALVTTELRGDTLVMGAAGTFVELPLGMDDSHRRHVHVWHDAVEAVAVAGDSAAALSDHLGVACALVFLPEHVIRPLDPRFSQPGDRVGFADGFPLLLASRASLAELNGRLETPVPMNRFRPNVVVEGGAAYQEDHHDHARIGTLAYRMPKRCGRCTVITIDQASARVTSEPLRTLARYRRVANAVYFGQNLVPDEEGSIAIGDEVTYWGGPD
ncbi:MAG: Flavodoxin reductase [Labilithrix sp.]|nr:Flavodoxin reductase [Labilithrix sp.]